jgi:hypothetical protein
MLAKHPNIDTNRIYLFSTSAETHQLTRFVDQASHVVRGVILFDPGVGLRLSPENVSEVFIAAGTGEDQSHLQLIGYQDLAARAGVPVKLVLQPGGQHVTRSVGADRERTRQFARFIQSN